MSEDTLSSYPPNLPIPTTISGSSQFKVSLQGKPKRVCRSKRARNTAIVITCSAKKLSAVVTSAKPASWFRSRKASQIIKRCLAMRIFAMNSASTIFALFAASIASGKSANMPAWSNGNGPLSANHSNQFGLAMSQRSEKIEWRLKNLNWDWNKLMTLS